MTPVIHQVPVTASVLATVSNRLRPLVGTGDGKICALDVGTLDLVVAFGAAVSIISAI